MDVTVPYLWFFTVGRTIGPALEVREALKVLESMKALTALSRKVLALQVCFWSWEVSQPRGRDAIWHLRPSKMAKHWPSSRK